MMSATKFYEVKVPHYRLKSQSIDSVEYETSYYDIYLVEATDLQEVHTLLPTLSEKITEITIRYFYLVRSLKLKVVADGIEHMEVLGPGDSEILKQAANFLRGEGEKK